MAVKVATERKPGSQVVLSVEVPADQVTTSLDRAYQKLAPRVRVQGFRPGKAPRPMVERQIGWTALRQEAMDLLLPTAYNAALDETGLDPIDVPRVEVDEFDRDRPFRFRATVSIKPEVALKDYHDIRVPRPKTDILEKDVDEAIDRLRSRFAELHAVERPVQAGDFLTVDLHVLKGGAVLVGESQVDAQVEVDRERLLPGLADGLVGLQAGETRDIGVSLPADYPKADLAGSTVIFRVLLKAIKERRLPPVDDDLAKQVGRGQTLSELRQEVQDELQEGAARSDEQRFENELLKALGERVEVEVPEALIEREVNRQIRELELRLQEQGVRFDRYLQYTNTSLEVLRSERHPQASQKVRLELALEAVANREGLSVGDEEVDDAVSRALAEDPDLARRAEDLRTADPVRGYFRHQLLMRKTIDHLSALAGGESSDTMSADASEGEIAQPVAAAGARARKAGHKQER